jgi:hypothetical protein
MRNQESGPTTCIFCNERRQPPLVDTAPHDTRVSTRTEFKLVPFSPVAATTYVVPLVKLS